MRPSTLLLGALALTALATTATAQDRGERERVRARALVRAFGGDEDRPVIGVSTTSSGERDTLGLLVVSVTSGGPADKAGIEEGNRIASVNGTNLRLAAVDAGERDMQGMTTRRLSREIGKVEPGDEVELRVWQNGRYRDIKVKTVAAEDLPGRTRTSREDFESRGVLGLRVGGSGSRRDTLGVLIVGLTMDGPAEKAGLVEGDRIAAIGDVDLRVPAADAGDRWMSSTRVNRLLRELRDVEPGESVTLRVRSGDETRTVIITAVAAKDLAEEHGGAFWYSDGFDVPMPAIAPMPPMAPMAPMAPMIEMAPMRTPKVVPVPAGPGVRVIELDDIAPEIELYLDEDWAETTAEAMEKAKLRLKGVSEQLREALEAIEARERDVQEREIRLRESSRDVVRSASWATPAVAISPGEASFAWTAAPAAPPAAVRAVAPAAPSVAASARSANTLTLPGLTLSLINRELAGYFGAGAERGLLVLSADARWDGLREGDVILAVDGRETSGFSCVSSLTKGERSVVVMRDGRRETMKVNGQR